MKEYNQKRALELLDNKKPVSKSERAASSERFMTALRDVLNARGWKFEQVKEHKKIARITVEGGTSPWVISRSGDGASVALEVGSAKVGFEYHQDSQRFLHRGVDALIYTCERLRDDS